MPHTEPYLPGGAGAPPDAVRFVLRLGHALHSYGYAAHQLEETLRQVAERLGVTAQFFSAPTSIIAAFGPQEEQRTHLMRVEPGELDLGKLAELHAVTRGVMSGLLSPADGAVAIERVAGSRARYPWVLSVLAWGLVAGAATRFLGGGWREIVASTGISLVIGLFAAGARRVPGAMRIFEPASAFAASGLATLAAVLLPPISVYVTTMGGLIVLLPGLMLTTALTELSTGNLQSGTARLMGAAMVFLGLTFGVALGAQLVERLAGTPGAVTAVALPAWSEWVALLVAPLCFTVLLRAAPRDLGWILLVGVLGFGANRLAAPLLGAQLGVFVGALTVAVASNIYGRLLDRPPPVTSVPGILLLVPGTVGFRSLSSMLDHQVMPGVEAAFTMALTAVALVAGLLAANVVMPPAAVAGAGK